NTVLLFPPGKFVIKDKGILLAESNIALVGSSVGETVFLPGNPSMKALIQTLRQKPSIKNILIKNITFQASNQRLKAERSISFDHTKMENIFIYSCRFQNLKSHYYLWLSGTNNLTISNCVFEKYGEVLPGSFFIRMLDGYNVIISNNL